MAVVTQTVVKSGTGERARGLMLRLPFAAPAIAKMIAIYIGCLFLLPATLLDLVGYDYDSIDGSALLKIHPSTYWGVLTLALFVLTYPDKGGLLRYYLDRKMGTLFFFGAALLSAANIILGKRQGIGTFFDTNLNLFCCCMLLPFLTTTAMAKLERFLHWFFLINATMGLLELVLAFNFFPLVIYSTQGTALETRATAMLSHPLHAATLTSIYVVSLLVGGGPQLAQRFRLPMILLQMAALVAFGGRTALLVTSLALMAAFGWHFLRFLSGYKYSRTMIIAVMLLIPFGVVAIAGLAYAGFFDVLLERMVDDGGSARARLVMFDLVRSFKTAQLLWGGEPELIVSQVVGYGLEWGVENPIIHMIVYQGLVVMVFVVLGLMFVLREIYTRALPQVVIPMLVFVGLVNTFGSLGSRFYTVSSFVVMISALFVRKNVPKTYVT